MVMVKAKQEKRDVNRRISRIRRIKGHGEKEIFSAPKATEDREGKNDQGPLAQGPKNDLWFNDPGRTDTDKVGERIH